MNSFAKSVPSQNFKENLFHVKKCSLFLKFVRFMCDALHNSIPFTQFRKPEKHLQRSVS